MENNKWFTITIHINDICNFRCEYCIGTLNMPSIHNSYIMPIDTIKFIVFVSNKYLYDYNIQIKMFGGEPLLSKNINDIINELLHIKSLNKIYILTNNSLPLNRIVINDKIKYRISYHTKELNKYKNSYKIFLKNIEFLNTNKISYSIKLLAKDYEDKEVFDNYNKLSKIIDRNKIDIEYLVNTPFYKNSNAVEQLNIHNNEFTYPKRSITIYKEHDIWKMKYQCEMYNTYNMQLYSIKEWVKIRNYADTYIQCNQNTCVCYSCEM